jgi:hypothetical protein
MFSSQILGGKMFTDSNIFSKRHFMKKFFDKMVFVQMSFDKMFFWEKGEGARDKQSLLSMSSTFHKKTKQNKNHFIKL